MDRIGRLIAFVALGAIVFVAAAPSALAADYPDQGAALAGCQAALNANIAADPKSRAAYGGSCSHTPASTPAAKGSYDCKYEFTNRGNTSVAFCIGGGGRWHYYPGNQSCEAQGGYTGQGPWSSTGGSAKSGSAGCRNGCDGEWYRNVDGTHTWTPTGGTCPEDPKKNCEQPSMAADGYYWNPLLKVCEPPNSKCKDGTPQNSFGQCAPEPCPEGMALQPDSTCKKKASECPAGNVKSPDGRCLPGDGQCASGEARGKDGTCKRDSDGDGTPDEEQDGDSGDPDDPDKERSTFSGGDDCKSPPSCSGDAIMCGQARIQWRIDCNTRRNRNIAGGACNAMPVCTGDKCDALEYSQLLMQWRTACALEKLKGGEGGDGAQPEWTKVGGMSQNPGDGASADDTKVLSVKRVSVDSLDQTGFGGGGSCIGFAGGGGGGSGGSGVSSGFMEVLASPPAIFCNYIALIKAVIITMAAVTCGFILVSGGRS